LTENDKAVGVFSLEEVSLGIGKEVMAEEF